MVKELCFRCKRPVYPTDRIGPLKDGTLFHHGCFKCYICGTRLTLKSYCHNRNNIGDQEVYCSNHVPQANPHDPVPHRSNLLGSPGAAATAKSGPAGNLAPNIGANGLVVNLNGHHENGHSNARVAADHNNGNSQKPVIIGDMRIQHALKATEIQKPYPKMVHPGAKYALDYDQQTRLELVHRKEEDDLYRTFSKQREEEEKRFTNETKEEWEKALTEFAKKYERNQNNNNNINKNFVNNNNGQKSTSTTTTNNNHELDREDFIRQLTLKRDHKKQTMRMILKERERSMTADLVDKQSREMMDLFRQARQQTNNTTNNRPYRDESSDQQHQNGHHQQNQTSRTISHQYEYQSSTTSQDSPNSKNNSRNISPPTYPTTPPPTYPTTPPPPFPPKVRKHEISSEYFTTIDQTAISIAQSEVHTFTDLIRALTFNCKNDVEVARAIYRWITVKNLNTMEFDHHIDPDTPLGILRGIKYGTESYHVLFKRLCSYAGLHCVVIKGYSKSAGYQPGVRFDDSRFRNTWNAVFLEDSWRFVQCNWGARHLVNSRGEGQNGHSLSPSHDNSGSGGGVENLRYEYDDHYFMTDPEEFIYEFFPNQPEWQLLKRPITLINFENLPFIRSLFFRYCLRFSDTSRISGVGPNAVLNTDDTGTTTIALDVPHAANNNNDEQHLLIFHYNLKFYDTEKQEFDRVNLKRFVMQSTINDGRTIVFRIHLPTAGDFLLDIFANDTTARQYLTGRPMKFKSVCKFKVNCRQLNVVMVPLPECAGGEWGPYKAQRLFGMRPMTHPDAIINHNNNNSSSMMTSSSSSSRINNNNGGNNNDLSRPSLKIQFRLDKPLAEFVASLRKNGIDDRRLSKLIKQSLTRDGLLIFEISFPEDGQYGFDIYTRENHAVTTTNNRDNNNNGHLSRPASDPNLLTHCCKYLINVRLQM